MKFERLLAEFKAVADRITMPELTPDEIATAAGPQKLNNAANCTWAVTLLLTSLIIQASDIAQRQIRRALLPLIDQLFRRAVYIMKRLVDVVDSMMEASRRQRKRNGKLQDPQASQG